jgi:hypothetical protein
MSTMIEQASQSIRRGVRNASGWPRTLRRVLVGCGIASSLLYVVANVLGPIWWPGYSPVDQTVSELFAVDAPSRPLVVSLLFVHGVLALAFGIGVLWSAADNRALRVTGWLLIGIGVVDQLGPFFPMHTREALAAGGGTYSDTMHIVLTMAISLLTLLAMGFGAAAFGKRFRFYSVATMITLALFGALASLHAGALGLNAPTPWQGVYERINIAAYLLWMAVLAVIILKSEIPVRGRPA